MKLYEIKFDNEGSLVNPYLESPIYVKANTKIEAIKKFFEECQITHSETDLSPNNIKCEFLVQFEDIIMKW